MKNYIDAIATPEQSAAISTQLEGVIGALAPFKVLLNDHEKVGKRSMSTGREGYVRMISQIASVNISSLPREHDPQTLNERLDYDQRLEKLRQQVMALAEIITETQFANSIDTMRMVDTFAANLQISRRSNAALDMAMREVDQYNHRYNRHPGRDDAGGDPPMEGPADDDPQPQA